MSFVACGSRTSLDFEIAETPDASRDASIDVHASDAGHDAKLDARDTGIDAPVDARPDATCASCDDGVACTHDSCVDGGCVHVADDSLCPPGLLCSALGCGVFAYAVTSNDIVEVALPSGNVRRIGPNTDFFSDIALHPNGTLYGVSASYPTALYTINRTSGVTMKVTNLVALEVNGLDAAPDGTLFASADTHVYRVDIGASTLAPIAPLPDPWKSSGDLVVVGGRIFVSVRQGIGDTSDALVEVDRNAGTSRMVGLIGSRCVYGLAAFGPTLYGFTCEGKILTIDFGTGAGTVIAVSGRSFNGATAR